MVLLDASSFLMYTATHFCFSWCYQETEQQQLIWSFTWFTSHHWWPCSSVCPVNPLVIPIFFFPLCTVINGYSDLFHRDLSFNNLTGPLPKISARTFRYHSANSLCARCRLLLFLSFPLFLLFLVMTALLEIHWFVVSSLETIARLCLWIHFRIHQMTLRVRLSIIFICDLKDEMLSFCLVCAAHIRFLFLSSATTRHGKKSPNSYHLRSNCGFCSIYCYRGRHASLVAA
jgi:hypothetical protein